MRKLITKLAIFVSILCCSAAVNAQDYSNSIAYKNGIGPGFTLKRLLDNESAFSVQVTFKDGGVNLAGFRSFHQVAFPKKNSQFFFYYGYGTHIRYYTQTKKYNYLKPFRPGVNQRGNFFAFGLDGLVGLEYRLLKYPFVIASDINPNFEFGGANFFKVNMDMYSLSIAFTF